MSLVNDDFNDFSSQIGNNEINTNKNTSSLVDENVDLEQIESLKNSVETLKNNVASAEAKLSELQSEKAKLTTFPLLGRIFGGIATAAAAVVGALVAVATLPVSLPLCLGLGATFIAGASLFGVAQHKATQNIDRVADLNAQIANQETSIAQLSAELAEKEAEAEVKANKVACFDINARLQQYEKYENEHQEVKNAEPKDKAQAIAKIKYPDKDIFSLGFVEPDADIGNKKINLDKLTEEIEIDATLTDAEIDGFILNVEYSLYHDTKLVDQFNEDANRMNYTIADKSFIRDDNINANQLKEEINSRVLELADNDPEIANALKCFANQSGLAFVINKLTNTILTKTGMMPTLNKGKKQVSIAKISSNTNSLKQYQIILNDGGEFTVPDAPKISGESSVQTKLNITVKTLNNGQKQFLVTLAEPMLAKATFRPKNN